MAGVSDRARVLLISTRCDASGGVLLDIQDSGEGIRADDVERLFVPFYTTKPNGMGMGLSICRSIVEAHGGEIWASPNVPRGATFHVLLPAHADGERTAGMGGSPQV
jgi:signal transduction histidine kinase